MHALEDYGLMKLKIFPASQPHRHDLCLSRPGQRKMDLFNDAKIDNPKMDNMPHFAVICAGREKRIMRSALYRSEESGLDDCPLELPEWETAC